MNGDVRRGGVLLLEPFDLLPRGARLGLGFLEALNLSEDLLPLLAIQDERIFVLFELDQEFQKARRALRL